MKSSQNTKLINTNHFLHSFCTNHHLDPDSEKRRKAEAPRKAELQKAEETRKAEEARVLALTQFYHKLLEKGEFSDLSFVSTDNKQFNVHKPIISIQCPQLLKKSQAHASDVVDVPLNASGDVADVFFKYVYTNDFDETNLSPITLVHLFKLSCEVILDK